MASVRGSAPRPRLSRIQYEDFDPKTEWKEEAEANILLLYLPDFLKEQIRITYVDSSRAIIVFGERPITTDHNKWSRFQKSFTVPENCDVLKIVARFQDGVLTITLPKVTVTPPPIPSEPASTSDTDKEENEKKPLMQQLEEPRKQNFWETYVNHDENCLGWDEIRKAMDVKGSSIPGLMAYLGIFHADSNGDGKVESEELDELLQFMENSPFSIGENSK